MSLSRRTLVSLLSSSFASRRAFGDSMGAVTERTPNFVIFLCDDLGYGDLGCFGNTKIRTPHIDRLASEGARLTHFYAMPTCTPSRAALLTGRYPVRSGLTRVLIPKEHFGIPNSEITLAGALKDRGYRTACIGKWHLGSAPRYRPNRHGFDEFYGILYSNDMMLPVLHWPPIRLFRNEVAIESPAKQSTLTQRFTKEALRFIDANKDNPFLLYMPYTMPHLPWAASERFSGRSKHGTYGDAVEELDWSVGEVLSALGSHGLEKSTIVFFLSDNGPELSAPEPAGSTGGLRGGKGSTWEGGVRVPCIIRRPDIIPAGVERSGICCLMDIFATCIELAGVTLPSDYVIDGRNLLSHFQSNASPPQPEFGYYFNGQLCALRSGDWKVHLHKRTLDRSGRYRAPMPCEPPELYNLVADPGERVNVYQEQTQIALSLARAAADFETAIKVGKRAPPRWRSLLPSMRRRKP